MRCRILLNTQFDKDAICLTHNNGDDADDNNTACQTDGQSADSRANKFHRKDSEVTVNDLWHTWWKSEVHNWTVDQTIE